MTTTDINNVLDDMLDTIGLDRDDLIKARASERINEMLENGIISASNQSQKDDHIANLIDQQYSDHETEDIVKEVYGNIDYLSDAISEQLGEVPDTGMMEV